MSAPIQSGDDAIVIGGLGRKQSPNLGLRVRVISRQGESPWHGVIWRCEGAGVKQLQDNGDYVITGWADFSVRWLKKADALPAGKVRDAVDTGLTA